MAFTHLHVHTEYSLLDGASKIPELIAYAKELGMDSIAITDHGVMYGAVEFYQEAKKQGLKPILGCEVYVAPNRFDKTTRAMNHLILLAETDEGYHNLMKLVSISALEGYYYKPRIDKQVLRQYSKGLICLSACVAGEVPSKILQCDLDGARRSIEEFIDIFGKDNYFLEIQDHDLDEERLVRDALRQLAQEYGLGLAATNDLHYVHREDAEGQDVLLCIQTTSTVDEEKRMRFNNDSYYLKSEAEMAQLFDEAEYPGALENTAKIAARCNVNLEFGKLLLPEFPVPEGFNDVSYLRHLCEVNIPRCYGEETPQVRERLEFELQIINQMGYACYFLIVWDFIDFCKRENIPVGPGRGSAAGSIVAYLLGITNIEPLHHQLLFERFLNPERVSMPDIDTDFCFKKRDAVIDYVVQRYGKERVAQIITFGTLQARAAVRDVGKALGMSYGEVDAIAKLIPRDLGITLKKALEASNDLREAYEGRPEVKRLIDLSMSVEGLPRNPGTHAAGVIIAPRDLKDYVPLQLDREERNIITQYDKDRAESMGLLKMDFLGLRTLTVIHEAIDFIKATTGEIVDIDKIPLDDAKTCQMLCDGDTYGVFQLESSGITKLVMDLAPESFEDLIPLVALYRPGPLGTGMADDFIAGRHGKRTAQVLHPLMEPILEDTYGVILYQEQVMQITSALAGFTLGQADILRRAMGKKKAKELDSMRQAFVDGARDLHQIPEELSQKIFDLLQHFAGYGFNKSHSVAYALVAYQTAYLKAHWPAQYMAAFLNSVMGDSDKLSWYISLCRNSGIKILPPDINSSGLEFTVQQNGTIRFGLAGIKSIGDAAVNSIVSQREEGPYTSLQDFCQRVSMRQVNKRSMENLIRCGSMDSLGFKRAQLLAILEPTADWASAWQKDRASGQIGLFGEDSGYDMSQEIKIPNVEELPQHEILQNEKELLGFYVTGHPLDQYREIMQGYMPLYQFLEENELDDEQPVQVGGIVTDCVLKNTKRGDTMALLTLEDFTARMQVVVFPKTYRQDLRYIYQDAVVAIDGRYSADERERKLLAQRVVPLVPRRELQQMLRQQRFKGKEEAQTSLNQAAPGSPVYLRIAGHLENALTQRELGKIFQQYHGCDPVFLDLLGSRRRIKTTAEFWVDSSSPQFQEAVRRLLGPEGLILQPK